MPTSVPNEKEKRPNVISPRRYRVTLLLVSLSVLLVISWYAVRGYKAWKLRREMGKPWDHAFRDPDLQKPASPRLGLLGITLGESRPSDVAALTKRLGLACEDRSIRALMQRRRQERITKNRLAGKVDAISGATWNRPSPRERNPTIRWNCDKVPASVLEASGEFQRPPSLRGRLLFVFDSPDHPLRHMSYQYDALPTSAFAAFGAAVRHYEARLGPPSQRKDDRPIFAALKPSSLPSSLPTSFPTAHVKKYDRFLREWNFADAQVRLVLRSYGGWFNVSEVIEIPWPIRPDASAFLRRSKTRP